VQGSASELPFNTASIDLITAFEVSEQLEDWEGFLLEAARVLSSDGVLLVSARNAEVLNRHFAYVKILAQDQEVFLAACSYIHMDLPSFSAHNVLREREDELASLREELAKLRVEQQLIRNSAWLRLGRLLGVGPTSDYGVRIGQWLARRRAEWNRLYAEGRRWVRFAGSAGAVLTSGAVLGAVDVGFIAFGKRRLRLDRRCGTQGVSVIIPNWNGLTLLKANLPALVRAALEVPACELVVVDNASDDGSIEFVREKYPQIRLLCLERNSGFAKACNIAARQVRNDIVVFLNNDMLVEDGFLSPLLQRFTDPRTFAVTSQIFFSDPRKQREETGLTELWWEAGKLRVGHRVDPLVTSAFPSAYAGGGSSAFDREKFLKLGGFSGIFEPFYFEDTDLGYVAWKRGWNVLYEPASVVHHKHRGTIGKHFSGEYIDGIVRRNSMLFCWKNIHDWRMLGAQLCSCIADCYPAGSSGAEAEGWTDSVYGAFSRLRQLVVARWRAHEFSEVSDKEAMLRPLGGYYRDRFLLPGAAPGERLNVLFVSPYPIEPPVHGGAVFMREAITALQTLANVHVLSFVDIEEQLEAQKALLPKCSWGLFLVRPHFRIPEGWTMVPTAIREFQVREFAWALHRSIVLQEIDVVQLEYTVMGQYAGRYENLPCMLFEHDISVQSLWRQIRGGNRSKAVLLEYLRMRSYEPKLLRRMTRVQVCSRENGQHLSEVAGGLKQRIDCDVRACIDTDSYGYSEQPRQPNSLLFVGSFRHAPNLEGLKWFVREVFPLVLGEKPRTILNVVGSGAPGDVPAWLQHASIRFVGPVENVRAPLGRYSVFICPVLTGSGVRVKLLEAFAAGIPAVATSVGAEGLAPQTPPVCELADSPREFANATIRLLGDEKYRLTLSRNARAFVESDRDSRKAAVRLEAVYRREVERRRAAPGERAIPAVEYGEQSRSIGSGS
jgi:GT2 family glycosyltransferase/glycosyltransferase involved in cell wall biosynthesis